MWNREGRWQGALDSPLTDLGRAQARAMRGTLCADGVTPRTHRFYTSPQGRARKTAEIVLGGAGRADPDPRLAEIGVGNWAGRLRDDIAAEAALGAGAHVLDLYRAAPGGEAFGDLFARVSAFLRDLEGPAVIVTHGITSRFLRTAAMGRSLDRVADVPGGQGVIHRVRDGAHETLDAAVGLE